jgi:para-aminobenzoate synthetase component II
MTARVVVLDNRDSFVHTLVGYLRELGAQVDVSDATHLATADVEALVQRADAVVISPGPGRPEDARASLAAVPLAMSRDIPLLGVCLGHQVIAVALGGRVEEAPELRHGMTSRVEHDASGVLARMPRPAIVGRYHSLAVVEEALPDELRVTARTSSGTVMAITHRTARVDGVQFHPESVLTEGGYLLLGTWLESVGIPDAAARGSSLSPHRGALAQPAQTVSVTVD